MSGARESERFYRFELAHTHASEQSANDHIPHDESMATNTVDISDADSSNFANSSGIEQTPTNESLPHTHVVSNVRLISNTNAFFEVSIQHFAR